MILKLVSILFIYKLGAVTEGKKRTTRKGAGTEKDCHGKEDARMVKDENRSGKPLLL